MRDFTDDLRAQRTRLDEAAGYLKIGEARNRLVELESEMQRPDLWDDGEAAKKVNTDYANVKDDVDTYDGLASQLEDAEVLGILKGFDRA
jgi:peptide chain release factor 2